MKLAFVILAHNFPQQAERLVDRLTAQGGTVALHWDKRNLLDLPARLKAALPAAQSQRLLAADRIQVDWGLWSVVQATLNGLQALASLHEPPDYVTLLSGHDYPLRPLSQLREFLTANHGVEHIECVSHEEQWVTEGLQNERWEYRHFISWGTHPRLFDKTWHLQRSLGLKRRPPAGITPHFGSQWWTLSWPSIRRILDAASDRTVIRFFRRTWVPDEMFFQTMLVHTCPSVRTSGMGLTHYEFAKNGIPLVYYDDHFDFLASQPLFFARKISPRSGILRDRLDALAASRTEEPGADLAPERINAASEAHYSQNSLHLTNAKVFGRQVDPVWADLATNNTPYTAILGTAEADFSPVMAELGSRGKSACFGELFRPDLIDYGPLAPPCPLYPAEACALRDQKQPNFLSDLIRANSGKKVAFCLRIPRDGLMASLVVMDPRAEIVCVVPDLETGQPVNTASHHLLWDFIRQAGLAGKSITLFPGSSCGRNPDPTLPARILLAGRRLCALLAKQHAETPPLLQLPQAGGRKFTPEVIRGGSGWGSALLVYDLETIDAAGPLPGDVVLLAREAHPGIPASSGWRRVEPSAGGAIADVFREMNDARVLLDTQFLRFCQELPFDEKMSLLSIGCRQLSEPESQQLLGSLFGAPERALALASLPGHFAADWPGSVELPRWAKTEKPQAETGFGNADRPLEVIVHDVHQLVRRSRCEEASSLVCQFLESPACTPGRLTTLLRTALPANAKWWIDSLLANESLGPEQVSDALLCAAEGAGPQSVWRRLLLESSCYLAPGAQISALAAGWAALEDGDPTSAGRHFERIQRCYGSASLVSPWPAQGSVPWPHCGAPSGHLPLPAHSASWPRITIVTPSFNQGRFLEETILSVLNQGYPNLQYIVVDGGSTDGSREILERYRSRIDRLIIEPDEGQSQAINKGFALAEGELLGWLNSDDMYGPGALFAAASRYLKTKADVLAGICLEHSGRKLATINKPSVRPEEFTANELSRIFERWFRGAFFYQPEVFFTKRLFDGVGGLNENLEFAMDGDLWFRFGEQGAHLQIIDWPVALFRKHARQKTSSPWPWLKEMCRVRSLHCPPRPDRAQVSRWLNALQRWRAARTVGVAVERQTIDDGAAAFLHRLLGPGLSFVLTSHAEADIILFHPVGPKHWKFQAGQIARLPQQLVIGWLDSDPSDPFDAFAAAGFLDLVAAENDSIFEFVRQSGLLFGSELLQNTEQAVMASRTLNENDRSHIVQQSPT